MPEKLLNIEQKRVVVGEGFQEAAGNDSGRAETADLLNGEPDLAARFFLERISDLAS
jgi:hypothetical protein